MITLTPKAIAKVKEFIAAHPETPVTGLRVGVRGGGCSGFSYAFVLVQASEVQPEWNVFDMDGLRVYVDQMSAMYLEGVEIDYVEQVDGSGFKFHNPNVKSTCGCGQSFSA